MAERVRITDVSPRDGLQNEPGVIPTAEKVRLVELLCATRVDEVEVTSFVSPKWVPQLGDAAEVLAGASNVSRPVGSDGHRSPIYAALVPNEQGMEAALRQCGEGDEARLLEKIAVFTAASETFSRKNTNASIAETLERFRSLLRRNALPWDAGDTAFVTRGYISCVIACPFEGPIAPAKVGEVAARLYQLGLDEIDLGDTIGAGTPDTVIRMLDGVRAALDAIGAGGALTLHLHDTFGRAADCVKAALDWGIRSFDGSVAGLGGCPYASTPGRRAPGNISTELLVRTIEGAGYKTGVDLGKLEEAARFARGIVAKARGQS